MLGKYNVILNTTTFCNYNCSYCDVIKDKKNLKAEDVNTIIGFIENNYNNIIKLKFFGGEPLLAWGNIKHIIDNTFKVLGKKFEIVTNTVFLSDEIGKYFSAYFDMIFFSIDSENNFDFNRVFYFIDKYNLGRKVFFNLIISPKKEIIAYQQFIRIYNSGYKNFNILPVYFTKDWDKSDLIIFGIIMKNILEKKDKYYKNINLHGFQNNSGYNPSLTNESIFINIDLNVYFSDFVITSLGEVIKDKLIIGKLNNLFNFHIDSRIYKQELLKYENKIINNKKGQLELHNIMDYFSKYLNNKEGIIKD